MRPGPLVTIVYPDLEHPGVLRTLTGQHVAPSVIHVPEICGIGRHAHIHIREWVVQLAQVRPHGDADAVEFWRRLASMLAIARAVECPCCMPALSPAPVSLTADLVTAPVVGLTSELVNVDADLVRERT